MLPSGDARSRGSDPYLTPMRERSTPLEERVEGSSIRLSSDEDEEMVFQDAEEGPRDNLSDTFDS